MTAKLTTVSDYEAAIAALDDDERDALKLDEEMHWLLAGGIFCDVFQRRGLVSESKIVRALFPRRPAGERALKDMPICNEMG